MVLVAQTTFNRKQQYTIARLYTVPFTPLQSLYTALENTKEPHYTKRTSKNEAVSHTAPIYSTTCRNPNTEIYLLSEFMQWKEHEEEQMDTMYIKRDQTYFSNQQTKVNTYTQLGCT